MHELSLADAVVAIARDHARGRRVSAVEVRIGRLRQVVPDALAFAFELTAHGTVVAGAELAVEEIPARVSCDACGAESDVDAFPFACAGCGALDVEVIRGDEFHVVALEVEEVEFVGRK